MLKKSVRVCDECKARIDTYKCEICSKDICVGCRAHLSILVYPREHCVKLKAGYSSGAYRKVICGECRDEYKKLLEKLYKSKDSQEIIANLLLKKLKDLARVDEL